jgi:hypothetical protein
MDRASLRDTKAGSEALLRMRTALQDQGAESAHCRPNGRRFTGDAFNGPVGITSMARRHVVRDRRMLAVAATTAMHGNALAAREHLHRPSGEARIDLSTRKAMGHAIEVVFDLDVVVDPDPMNAPFREDVRSVGNGFKAWRSNASSN